MAYIIMDIDRPEYYFIGFVPFIGSPSYSSRVTEAKVYHDKTEAEKDAKSIKGTVVTTQ